MCTIYHITCCVFIAIMFYTSVYEMLKEESRNYSIQSSKSPSVFNGHVRARKFYNISPLASNVLANARKFYNTSPSALNDYFAGGYVVDTKGCRIGYMDPYDELVRKYLSPEEPIICDKDVKGMLVYQEGNTLYINRSSLPKYGLTEGTLDCCYQKFSMIPSTDENMKKNWPPQLRYEDCIHFFTAVNIKDGLVKVKCSLPGNETYEDVFIFVEKPARNSIHKDGNVSVLIIGFDTVSRLNFHRQMPKSMQFLRDQNIVEMFGFHVIGESTYPNMATTLTGLSENELEKMCLQMEYKTFDDCPLIWKMYKSHGFKTAHGLDLGDDGLLTKYWIKKRRYEYKDMPTDYYLNLLTMAALNLRHEKRHNYHLCIGKRMAFEIMLNAISQFSINLKDLKTFSFFFTYSLSHDTLNLLHYADDYFYNFLFSLSARGVFNNTIVIVISDHGVRYGAFRNTLQGYLEQRLPLLFFMYPPWFARKYPKAVENLKANAHRLTTPYDLHKTLKDLIQLENISNDALSNRLFEKSDLNGKSLFLPIEETRTCADAGIPTALCACNITSVPMDVISSIIKTVATKFLIYLNALLYNYKQCSTLSITRIIDASVVRKYRFIKPRYGDSYAEEFRIIIMTDPCSAIFDVLVRYIPRYDEFEVLPPASRINMYRNQSYCVQNYIMKPFCCCKT